MGDGGRGRYEDLALFLFSTGSVHPPPDLAVLAQQRTEFRRLHGRRRDRPDLQALPQLVLGHVLSHSAVGLYNRAHVVSDIPDRIVLASATAVAFPALAAAVRQGRSLKSFICELWDILLCLFGRDLSCSRSWPTPPSRFSWVGSGLRSFLCYRSWPRRPGVVPGDADHAGTWRSAPIEIASWPSSSHAHFRTRPMLCGVLRHHGDGGEQTRHATIPDGPFALVRSSTRALRWREVWAALWKSAVVTASSAAGPVCVVAVADANLDLSIAATAMAMFLAVVGWLMGVDL